MQQLGTQKVGNKGTFTVDPEFKHKLKDKLSGESLKFCYQCGTCTAACPISKLIDIYKPNKLLELAKTGIRNMVASNAFLFCCACTLCTKNCPQGVEVHEIMEGLKMLAPDDENAKEFVTSGVFEDTVVGLAENMPLPVSYSWICMRPADDDTKDSEFSASIRNALKSALGRISAEAQPLAENAAKVAVIGSGPAGLSAAFDLAKAGLAVTIFEALPEAGGMLRAGIPKYRLPKDIIEAEIENVRAMGVEIKLNAFVSESDFEAMASSGEYAAIFISSGASLGRLPRIEGESLPGAVTALDFLRDYNITGNATVGKKVVVVGGGNVAMDAAGAALRSGAESVELFCLESRETMPAHEWEILDTAHDGVSINPQWGPRQVLSEDGKITGVEFIFCKSTLDENGRFSPVYDENKTQVIEADTVIFAIGQAPDVSYLGNSVGIFRGAVTVDALTKQTNKSGIFAGGDAVTGTATFIEAVADGKTAADSIISFIDGSL
ncbi:MAG: FAD-dependent oxidoreductase [Eubacteriaceae bacterium]|nr:FAD-dependent oxidoreductase [Eubacteriaceae bacterium]